MHFSHWLPSSKFCYQFFCVCGLLKVVLDHLIAIIFVLWLALFLTYFVSCQLNTCVKCVCTWRDIFYRSHIRGFSVLYLKKKEINHWTRFVIMNLSTISVTSKCWAVPVIVRNLDKMKDTVASLLLFILPRVMVSCVCFYCQKLVLFWCTVTDYA